MNAVRARAALAAVLLVAAVRSQSPDPLLAEITALELEVRTAVQKLPAPPLSGPAAGVLAHRAATLRGRVAAAEARWSPRAIGEACFLLHCCDVNLGASAATLSAGLERGITRIRACPQPWHGLPTLLLTLTEVQHEQGDAIPLADRWVELATGWADEPKKGWLCVEAARSLMNRCKDPVRAGFVLDAGETTLRGLAEWPEAQRLELLDDRDLLVTTHERPLAGSRRDCLGQLALIRGFAWLSSNRPYEALVALKTARELLTATGNDHGLANVAHHLAEVWMQLGRGDRAIANAEQARRLYFEAPWAGPTRADLNGVRAMKKVMARVLGRRGTPRDLLEARALLEEIGTRDFLAKPGETNVDALVVWGEVLLAGPKDAADPERFREIVGALRRFCEPRNDQLLLAQADLLEAEWALRQRSLETASTWLRAARERLLLRRELPLLVRYHCLLGEAHLAADAPRLALAAFGAAGELLHESVVQERLWTFEAGIGAYQEMHSAALRGACKAYLALAAADGGGAPDAIRLLYGIVQQFHGFEAACLWSGVGVGVPDDPERRRLTDDLAREQLRWCASALSEALRQRALTRLRQEIHDADARLAGQAAAAPAPMLPRPASLGTVQQALQPGELLLECVDLGGRVAAFCITRDGATVHELASGPALADAVDQCAQWSAGASGERDAASVPALAALAKILLPADGWLDRRLAAAETQVLLVSPEGPLCRVPFAALLWRGRPLVERVAIGYVLSGTVLESQRRRAATPAAAVGGKLLALGNPRYARAIGGVRREILGEVGELAALPATADEVVDVAACFAAPDERPGLAQHTAPEGYDGELVGKRFHLLLGQSAREGALTPEMMRGVSFLHFACHARADVEAPQLSYLALSLAAQPAAGDHDEGLLRAGEFARLRGDYELLALSACETGGGALRGHEGVASMARAGQAAGARRVLSTMWRVGDASAGKLVASFYRAWLQEARSAPAALAHAQRAAIDEEIPVREWASFQLWGEGR